MGKGPEVPFKARNIIMQEGDAVVGFRLLDSRTLNPNVFGFSVSTTGVAEEPLYPGKEKDLTKRDLVQTVVTTKFMRDGTIASSNPMELPFLTTTDKLLTAIGELYEEPGDDPMIALTRSYLEKKKRGAVSDEEIKASRTAVEVQVRNIQELWDVWLAYKYKNAKGENPGKQAWDEIYATVGRLSGAVANRLAEIGIKFYQSLLEKPEEVIEELDDFIDKEHSPEERAIVSALRKNVVNTVKEWETGKELE